MIPPFHIARLRECMIVDSKGHQVSISPDPEIAQAVLKALNQSIPVLVRPVGGCEAYENMRSRLIC